MRADKLMEGIMPDTEDAPRTLSEDEIAAVLKGIADAFKNQLRAPLLATPADAGLVFEDVTFPALDGVPIEAWSTPCEGSDKLIVANHPRGFNRHGSPSHLEPWKSLVAKAGNDIEVTFIPDYRILHEAGYDVLTCDLRHHGQSGVGNGMVTSGKFESRDVVGSMRYVRGRADLAGMDVGLFSRCLGANSAIFALSRHPDKFERVRCLVAAQPLSPRFYYERQLALPEPASDRATASTTARSISATS